MAQAWEKHLSDISGKDHRELENIHVYLYTLGGFNLLLILLGIISLLLLVIFFLLLVVGFLPYLQQLEEQGNRQQNDNSTLKLIDGLTRIPDRRGQVQTMQSEMVQTSRTCIL